MDKTYQPQQLEPFWYSRWLEAGLFEPSGHGEPYSIMIPPPNVTGRLHMGHALQDTIMDTLIRFKRMQGCNTLWQVGTDHAGIATQMLVERKISQEEQLTRHDLGREQFTQRIWAWKAESGGYITQQLRRLGASVDWTRERFTMDEGFSHAVQHVFIQLFEQGLIYRGKRLVNWDPVLLTAISDLEVEASDEQGSLWYIRYPFVNPAVNVQGKNYLLIATTRPETLFGDVCIVVHPDDSRYQHLIGESVHLPLTDRQISILADESVEHEFGSGCLKVTPAHDFNDYEIAKRHQLPLINIFTPDAHIRAEAEIFTLRGEINTTIVQALPADFVGLTREAARQLTITRLSELNLLEKTEPHRLKIPRGDRSGVIIEPMLTDQWFVAVSSLAKPAIEVIDNGTINFVPNNYANMYLAWMHNIQDWCISRQLWWGHRIPAWYDQTGNIYVGYNETAIRAKYQLSESLILRQDNDVLDTWFSSALWTFATLGWPEKTKDLATFHPTSVLVTGFDIIPFWVARMIMMTLHFMDEVPFHTVYVHGLIRDAQGQKMSKSKGNVLDPIDLIDGISLADLISKRTADMMQPQKRQQIIHATQQEFPQGIVAHGTDALRFTFLSLASSGRDIKFDMSRLDGYRNFCNKLWNAARFVSTQWSFDFGVQATPEEMPLTFIDRYIRARLEKLKTQLTQALEDYRFDLAAQMFYEFVWNEYCDWYLECAKFYLASEQKPAIRIATRQTLTEVLEQILRLAHPMLPFISEEIWQRIVPFINTQATANSFLMQQSWPLATTHWLNESIITDVEWFKRIVIAIRNLRAEYQINPAKKINVYLSHADSKELAHLQQMAPLIKALTRLDQIVLNSPEELASNLLAHVGTLEIRILIADTVDLQVEQQRLTKLIEQQKKLIASLEQKLHNKDFISKAPPAIVATQQARLAEAQQILQRQIAQFMNLGQ